MLILLLGCATTPPIVATPPIVEMAWVRTDGRKVADDPALLQQGKSDIAACYANLDTGSPNDSARGCMSQKGYHVEHQQHMPHARLQPDPAALAYRSKGHDHG
jgi:hypothetical protein